MSHSELAFNSPLNTRRDRLATMNLFNTLYDACENHWVFQRKNHLPAGYHSACHLARCLVRNILLRLDYGSDVSPTWVAKTTENSEQWNARWKQWNGWRGAGRDYWDLWARELIGSLRPLPGDATTEAVLDELSWIHDYLVRRWNEMDAFDGRRNSIIDATDVLICLRRNLLNSELLGQRVPVRSKVSARLEQETIGKKVTTS